MQIALPCASILLSSSYSQKPNEVINFFLTKQKIIILSGLLNRHSFYEPPRVVRKIYIIHNENLSLIENISWKSSREIKIIKKFFPIPRDTHKILIWDYFVSNFLYILQILSFFMLKRGKINKNFQHASAQIFYKPTDFYLTTLT